MKKITGWVLALAFLFSVLSGTALADVRSAFASIEGEAWTDTEGAQPATEGGGNAGYIDNGDWILYEDLDFGGGADGFTVNASTPNDGGIIELRLDDLEEGPIIGQCAISKTGGWDVWQDFSIAITPVSGVHDLYFILRGGSGYLFDINNFRFTSSGGSKSATIETEPVDDQDAYWSGSGRDALWNAMFNGSPQLLSAEEKSAFFALYAVDMKLVEWEAGDGISGSYSLRSDGSFRAEYRATFDDETEEYVGSGTIGNVYRLSTWVYALETGSIQWETEENDFIVQDRMLFEIPGATESEPGILTYELQNIAKQNGLDPASPVPYCFITAFDNSPLWYGQPASAGNASTAGSAAPAPAVFDAWTCAVCGYAGNDGNFCANCAAPRPSDLWTCPSCGHTGNDGNFCANCGVPKPAASWTCPSCGREGNELNFCPNCGTPKP